MDSNRTNPEPPIETATHTEEQVGFQDRLAEYFASSIGSDYQKLASFTKFVPRQERTW